MTAPAFEQLARPIQKWIRQKGWRELRPIQVDSINAILESQDDVIVSASTAGGKTEAAFLPLLSQTLTAQEESDEAGFDIVYIGPLKALINDQYRRLEGMCLEAEIAVHPWHGDVSASKKTVAQKNPSGVLLITPESLEAIFVRKGELIPRLFSRTRAVVIDELHTLLDSERGIQLRSLLTRLELAIDHSIRRIGLSATLGDMELAKSYLRPRNPDQVQIIKSPEAESELRLQLRGYTTGNDGDDGAAITEVSRHLFTHLRGSDNLIFAGSRQNVEIYADKLSSFCEEEHLPQEFYAHHASLSKEHREFVEDRLKDETKPTTAVCTSTLELGIDIGDVTCVAQVGSPFSVASLRQRLGRSGRREGQPAILRQYEIEEHLEASSHFSDQLRLKLVRSIAMIELLLAKWCEPPRAQSLNLSTLVHQTLSIIAERGGASAKRLFITLCKKGPFSNLTPEIYMSLLRHLGQPDVELIEQAPDGNLLLGRIGEKLVEHYSFYAVFKTPEEFRVVCEGKTLGTIPLDNPFKPGMTIIFSGRRWEILDIDTSANVLMVRPSKAGKPPKFGGDPGIIHDHVCQKMKELYASDYVPAYLDANARQLLAEARTNAQLIGLAENPIIRLSEKDYLLATWFGTTKNLTLEFALTSLGFEAKMWDGVVEVSETEKSADLKSGLRKISESSPDSFFTGKEVLEFEKFHPFLSHELLKQEALSARFEFGSLNLIPTLFSLTD